MVRAHDFHPVSIAACYSHGARRATPAPPGHRRGSGDHHPAGSGGRGRDAAGSWCSWPAAASLPTPRAGALPNFSSKQKPALGQVTSEHRVTGWVYSPSRSEIRWFFTCLETLFLFTPSAGACRRQHAEEQIALVSFILQTPSWRKTTLFSCLCNR